LFNEKRTYCIISSTLFYHQWYSSCSILKCKNYLRTLYILVHLFLYIDYNYHTLEAIIHFISDPLNFILYYTHYLDDYDLILSVSKTTTYEIFHYPEIVWFRDGQRLNFQRALILSLRISMYF
jgi:hypothetical protein